MEEEERKGKIWQGVAGVFVRAGKGMLLILLMVRPLYKPRPLSGSSPTCVASVSCQAGGWLGQHSPAVVNSFTDVFH